MIRYYCDRCGAEMTSSSIVTITPEAPVLSRARPAGTPIEICDQCGVGVRTMLAAKVPRAEAQEGEFTIKHLYPEPFTDELERTAARGRRAVQAAKRVFKPARRKVR